MNRILYVVKTNFGAKWALDQALWLKAIGEEIIVVLPSDTLHYALDYKAAGIKIISADLSIPINKPWKLFSRIKKLRNIVDEVKPNIIHFHFLTNIILARLALKKSKIPRVFQVPGPL